MLPDSAARHWVQIVLNYQMGEAESLTESSQLASVRYRRPSRSRRLPGDIGGDELTRPASQNEVSVVSQLHNFNQEPLF